MLDKIDNRQLVTRLASKSDAPQPISARAGERRLPATFRLLSTPVGTATSLTALPASSSRPVKALLGVYSVGFLVGTYTHARGILAHGLLAAPVPPAIGVYWDTLTLVDLLAVLLLWWRPRAGLWLALAIMVSDLAVNTWVYVAGYFGPPTARMVPLSLFEQALFGLLLFVTAPLVFAALQRAAKRLASG